MADSLKSFLVSIGFAVDLASQAKAEAAVKKTEGKITKVTQDEGEKRKKTDVKAATERHRAGDEEAKKTMARNAMIAKDTAKHITQITGLMKGVAEAAGIGVGVFATTGLIRSVIGTAQTLSRLQMESQRTGASPRNIERVVYALGQMGVDKGAARGSFDNFSNALKTSPGLKNMLAGNGIDVSGDDAQIYAQLGKFFRSLSPAVAINRAGSMGIDRDSMLSLGKQAELQRKMDEFGGASMGIDPDKAAKEGREFSAAYDKLATDLAHIQQRIDETFFKPLTAGMTGLSKWLEQNHDGVTALAGAFEVLAATSLLRVIPLLARITGILNLMKAPVWLLRLLGLGSATVGGLAAGALLGSTEPLNEGEPQIGPDGKLHRLDRDGKPTGPALGGPWDGKTAPPERGRVAFGRRIGTSHANPEVLAYLRASAAARGIEPDAAENLFAHEGLNVFDPNRPDHGGDGGSSFGPAQLHYGGINPAMPHAGMGDDFTKETGLDARDPSTWKAQIDFALDHAKKKGWGAWMGRGPAHKGVWDGIGTYVPPVHPSVAAAHVALRKMSESYTNPDGSSTMDNFDPKTGTVTAPGGASNYGALDRNAFAAKTPFGALDANAFRSPPIGTGGTTHVGGDATFNQNVTINGVQNPSEMAAALKTQANKGAGILRNMQGSSQ